MKNEKHKPNVVKSKPKWKLGKLEVRVALTGRLPKSSTVNGFMADLEEFCKSYGLEVSGGVAEVHDEQKD